MRDLVEVIFSKREGLDVRALHAEAFVEKLPVHVSSSIESIALDDISDGVRAEQKRVFDFFLDLRHSDNPQCIIQNYDSVRYRNKITDGFIDTFRMIFQTYDDKSLNSDLPELFISDKQFRNQVRQFIVFWGKQWAKQDRFSQNQSGKLHQKLMLARLDAWCEIADAYDSLDDIIDAVFVDAPVKAHDERIIDAEFSTLDAPHSTEQESITVADWKRVSKSVNLDDKPRSSKCEHEQELEKPITPDDWRKAAASVFREIEDSRRRINSKVAKKNKRLNIPTRKSVLLPGQFTIPFEKTYISVH